MTDEEAHQQDLEALEQAAEEAALASLRRPLTEQEMMALAYLGGIATRVYKELRK